MAGLLANFQFHSDDLVQDKDVSISIGIIVMYDKTKSIIHFLVISPFMTFLRVCSYSKRFGAPEFGPGF